MIRWSLVEPSRDKGDDLCDSPDGYLDGCGSGGLSPGDRWVGKDESGGRIGQKPGGAYSCIVALVQDQLIPKNLRGYEGSISAIYAAFLDSSRRVNLIFIC